MKNYMGAALVGVAVLAAAGCTDTWNEHYTGGQGTSATKSLWELIKENDNLSQFAELASKVQYHRDQDHPQANYTFEQMLSGTQLLTVWVPENSALTDAQWAQWKSLAETSPYTVQQQFLANSMVLFNQVATGGGIDTLTLLNGKKQAFDKGRFTMASLPLITKNEPATNGTLHTVGSLIPFDYNLYEYIKDASNASRQNINQLHRLVVANDTTYFVESLSIEGNPDADGNPTYVDSVYTTTNTMFQFSQRFPTTSNTDRYLTYDESIGAHIEVEDSNFVMILPTDAALTQATQMLQKYYKYASQYEDNVKKNQGESTPTPRKVDNVDSLTQKSLSMDLLSPLCLNLHFQPDGAGNIGQWKMDDFLANHSRAAYLLNTYGDTLRTDSTWNKDDFLRGRAVKMSNGYGIVTDTWPVPAKLYKPDLHIEVGYQSLYNYSAFQSSHTLTYYTFSNERTAWSDTVGHVSKSNFYYVAPTTPTSTSTLELRLVGTDGENREGEVMSGKYDIYAVMVPNFYMTSTDSITGDTVRHKFRARVRYISDASGRESLSPFSGDIRYMGEKVDTLLLLEDFEFPITYKNLRHSYPTLTIECRATATDRRNGYNNSYCIDRIILKSKD